MNPLALALSLLIHSAQTLSAAPPTMVKAMSRQTFALRRAAPVRVAPKPAEPLGSIDDAAEEARLCSLIINGGTAELAVRTLVGQTRLNLVLLSGAKTPVTLRLRDVPIGDAVRHLCALGGLKSLRLPHTIVIGPEAEIKAAYPAAWAEQTALPIAPPAPEIPAPLTLFKIIHLSHLPATEVAATLKGLYETRGLNAVAGPATTVPSLGRVDTASTGATASAAVQRTADPDVSRTLVLTGPAAVVQEALAAVTGLDVPRAQVSVGVTMHDVSNDALKDLGISWSFSPLTITERPDRGFLFGKFDRSNLGFEATIHALETADKARLLASPNVTVFDGERAFVLIGDRLNFPVLIGYSQANTPIFDVREERVGVYLQVSAMVASDGTVTMTIAPQVSTVRGFNAVGGASYPQIATREAQTTVRVRSGETIVLGGLIRDDEISNMEKVPILGDLPVFGELFRRRRRQKTSSQLVITVTPTIVPPLSAAGE